MARINYDTINMNKIISDSKTKNGNAREVSIKLGLNVTSIYKNTILHNEANGYINDFKTITLDNKEILEIADLVSKLIIGNKEGTYKG